MGNPARLIGHSRVPEPPARMRAFCIGILTEVQRANDLARSIYRIWLRSRRIMSPVLMNCGTMISRPLSSVAAFQVLSCCEWCGGAV